MKKRLLFCFLFILCSCSRANYKTVYTYEKQNVGMDFNISKTEVYEDRLELYCTKDLGTIQDVMLFDKELEKIREQYSFSSKNNKIIIYTSHPEKVSGLEITYSQDYDVRLRYLDSNQYAILEDIFACDIGMEEIGDRNAYYTKEELDEFDRIEQEKQAQMLEDFTKVEGIWQTKDGKHKIIFQQEDSLELIFEDEEGLNYEYITYLHLDEWDDTYSLDVECGIEYAPHYNFTLDKDLNILNPNSEEAYFR